MNVEKQLETSIPVCETGRVTDKWEIKIGGLSVERVDAFAT